MKNSKVLQELLRAYQEMFHAAVLIDSAAGKLDRKAALFKDLFGIYQALVSERDRLHEIYWRERRNARNQGKLRQAEEFALKAQVAKASGEAPAHRQLCRGDTSGK